MTGRVLSEEEFESVAERVDHGDEDVMSLIATLKQHGDTIAKLKDQIDQQHNFHEILNNDLMDASHKLNKAVELMDVQVEKYGSSNIMQPFVEFLAEIRGDSNGN